MYATTCPVRPSDPGTLEVLVYTGGTDYVEEGGGCPCVPDRTWPSRGASCPLPESESGRDQREGGGSGMDRDRGRDLGRDTRSGSRSDKTESGTTSGVG